MEDAAVGGVDIAAAGDCWRIYNSNDTPSRVEAR